MIVARDYEVVSCCRHYVTFRRYGLRMLRCSFFPEGRGQLNAGYLYSFAF